MRPNQTITHYIILALVPAATFIAGLSTADQAAGASAKLPGEDDATQAINHSYRHLSAEKRNSLAYLQSQLAIVVDMPGLNDEGEMTCRGRVPYSKHDRDVILHSKAYQAVEKRCPGGTSVEDVVTLGLMTKTQVSPYVLHYAMTDSGREHMRLRPNSNSYYTVFLTHQAVEHVLKVEPADNPYHVPAANVRFSAAPTVEDWAQPHVGPGKAISFRGYAPQKKTARLWKTDHGWQVFYIADR